MTDSTEWLRRLNSGEPIKKPTEQLLHDIFGKQEPEPTLTPSAEAAVASLGRAVAMSSRIAAALVPPRSHNHATEELQPVGDCGRCDWLRSRMEAK